MRIFVDCEFNGFDGALISMALVPEDASIEPWYECMEPFLWHEWVLANVRPVLGKEPVSNRDFRTSFLSYIQRFNNPTICADWYTDLVHFFSMFAGEDHTDSVGYACKAELVLIDNYESAIPHNALEDAKAIRRAWLQIQ